jgi:hypothetical protein
MKLINRVIASILIISLLIYSCKNVSHYYKGKNNSSFIVDIPDFEKSDKYQKGYNALISKLKLCDLKIGYNDFQIRIWRGDSNNDTGRIFILKNKDSKWSAQYITFNYLYLYDSSNISKTITELIPKSTWNKFINKFFDLGVLDLPNAYSISSYDTETDADGVTIEYANSDKYRLYSYGSIILNKEKVFQVNKIIEELKLIETEFGISGLVNIKGNMEKKNNLARTSNDSIISVIISDKSLKDTLPPKRKGINLETARKIAVLSISKEFRKDSSAENYSNCKSWSLTAKQIEYIIRKFKSMTSEEQYLSYSFYQCRISGEIKIDNIMYKYWIGAGGTLTLKNNNTTLHFGCSGKKCKEYFISEKLTRKEFSH